MDCHNWRSCQDDCDHCEVANLDTAKAVQAWNDPEYLVQNWTPAEILELLQQLGRQAQLAEEQRDHFRDVIEGWVSAQEQVEAEQQQPPGSQTGVPLMRLLRGFQRARQALGKD